MPAKLLDTKMYQEVQPGPQSIERNENALVYMHEVAECKRMRSTKMLDLRSAYNMVPRLVQV